MLTQADYRLWTGCESELDGQDWERVAALAAARLAGFLCLEALPEPLPDDLGMVLANFIAVAMSQDGEGSQVMSKKVRNFSINFSTATRNAWTTMQERYGDILDKYSQCGTGVNVETSAAFCMSQACTAGAGVQTGAPATNIPNGSITVEKLADEAVHAQNIRNGAVTNEKIAPKAIGSEHFQDGAIHKQHLDEELREVAVPPTATIERIEDGVTITLTDHRGTTTATIKDGATGPAGADGKDGEQGPAGADGTTAHLIEGDNVQIEHQPDGNARISAVIPDGATVITGSVTNYSALPKGGKFNGEAYVTQMDEEKDGEVYLADTVYVWAGERFFGSTGKWLVLGPKLDQRLTDEGHRAVEGAVIKRYIDSRTDETKRYKAAAVSALRFNLPVNPGSIVTLIDDTIAELEPNSYYLAHISLSHLKLNAEGVLNISAGRDTRAYTINGTASGTYTARVATNGSGIITLAVRVQALGQQITQLEMRCPYIDLQYAGRKN